MFSKDDLNDQLHNRYDGQGHRTQLAESLRRRHYDAHSEALEAHVGEERAIYIRERPGKWKSYAAAPGSAPVKQHQSATRSMNRSRSPGSASIVPLAKESEINRN